MDEAHTQQWQAVRDAGYETIIHRRMEGMALSDREDKLLRWLEAYGVDQAWKLAEPLAIAGMEVKTLEELTRRWQNDSTVLRDQGIRWLALSFEVMAMIHNGLRGAERISELVQSMKSYSCIGSGGAADGRRSRRVRRYPALVLIQAQARCEGLPAITTPPCRRFCLRQ